MHIVLVCIPSSVHRPLPGLPAALWPMHRPLSTTLHRPPLSTGYRPPPAIALHWPLLSTEHRSPPATALHRLALSTGLCPLATQGCRLICVLGNTSASAFSVLKKNYQGEDHTFGRQTSSFPVFYTKRKLRPVSPSFFVHLPSLLKTQPIAIKMSRHTVC